MDRRSPLRHEVSEHVGSLVHFAAGIVPEVDDDFSRRRCCFEGLVERSRKFFRDTIAEGIDADVAIARIELRIRHKRGIYMSPYDRYSLLYIIAGDGDCYSAPHGSSESAGDAHEGRICRDGDAIDRHDAISCSHARMIGRTAGERSHDDDLSGPYETHFGADPVECPRKMFAEYGCFFRRKIARIVVAYG